jgi:L-lactate dehydrogenase complex protein LldE
MPKAPLLLTCLDDQCYAATLQDMTRLLERLAVKLSFPPEQTGCGQPLVNNSFDVDELDGLKNDPPEEER